MGLRVTRLGTEVWEFRVELGRVRPPCSGVEVSNSTVTTFRDEEFRVELGFCWNTPEPVWDEDSKNYFQDRARTTSQSLHTYIVVAADKLIAEIPKHGSTETLHSEPKSPKSHKSKEPGFRV